MLTLAVLFGGRGTEHDVSCKSAAAVLSHISRTRFRVIPVGIDRQGNCWLTDAAGEKISDGSWETDGQKRWTFPVRIDGKGVFQTQEGTLDVDVVLPILHGDCGEDGKWQGLFETVGIPYVGADALCGALCFDKVLTKRLAEQLHIPVVPWLSFAPDASFDTLKSRVKEKFGKRPFPLFVKPSSLGSSIGGAKVRTFSALFAAFQNAASYGEVLVEDYVAKKREIEVAYLDGDLPLFSKPGEIRSKHGFYDYREKYEKPTAKIGLARLNGQTEERLYRYAKQLLLPLHLRDLCRFDFFLTQDGRLYFNEINTMPGMTFVSLYPKLLKEAGLSMEALIERWVALARGRRV